MRRVLPPQVPIFSLGYAAMAFVKALMTWAPEDIECASGRIKGTQRLCETWMPKEGVLSSLRGLAVAATGGGSGLSPKEIEGTLVHAEATLLSALLSLMEESLFAMVRCGMAIRSGWKLLLTCDKAMGGVGIAITDGPEISEVLTLDGPPPPPMPGVPPGVNRHIVSGVLFGMGVFNCIASVLPPIVLRIIAVLGFPCDRPAGMAQLRAALQTRGVRMPLAALFILAMRVLLPSFHSGDVGEHVREATAVIDSLLGRYPDSALFLWLQGRLARMQGDAAGAHSSLARCAGVQSEWPQLRDLCDYELAWCAAFAGQWDAVSSLFGRLQADNSWSRSFYAYMRGVAELQRGQPWAARRAFVECLTLWSQAARRVGNKVISAEQFAVRRAAEFVCLTVIPGAPDDPELGAILGAHVFSSRLPLPETVAVGSPAHAALLSCPLPLPGLEASYLFNAAPQMDSRALLEAVAQVDAALSAVTSGGAFDATSSVWAPRGNDATAPTSSSSAASAAVTWYTANGTVCTGSELTPTRVVEVLDAACAAAQRGMPTDASASSSWLPSSSPHSVAAAPNGSPPPDSPSAAASSAAAPSGRSLGLGRVFSSVVSTASSVVSSASSVVSSGGGGGGSSSGQLPAYGRPTPVSPIHTVAVAALVRGALCASLGRVDEAAAAFSWAAAAGKAGTLGRELHVYGYALYEHAVLYADGVKALRAAAAAAENAAAAAATVAPSPSGKRSVVSATTPALTPSPSDTSITVPSPASTEASSGSATGPSLSALEASRALRHARLLRSDTLAGLSPTQCASMAKGLLRAAREGPREDFNWKVRLLTRIHLTQDELRTGGGGSSKKKRAGAEAAAGAAAQHHFQFDADGADPNESREFDDEDDDDIDAEGARGAGERGEGEGEESALRAQLEAENAASAAATRDRDASDTAEEG